MSEWHCHEHCIALVTDWAGIIFEYLMKYKIYTHDLKSKLGKTRPYPLFTPNKEELYIVSASSVHEKNVMCCQFR